jgi:hypothetical protein
MRQRIAIAIKLLGGLLLHSSAGKHAEDFTPVLYTEKRMVRVASEPGQRSMTYGVIRGEKLQLSLHHSFHRMHHYMRLRIMRLNFSF